MFIEIYGVKAVKRPKIAASKKLDLSGDAGQQIVKSETKLVLRTHKRTFEKLADINKLQGALGRIDNAIAYSGLDDVFEIAAKYAASIALSHSLPDAIRDLVIGKIDESDFADLLYSQYIFEQNSDL